MSPWPERVLAVRLSDGTELLNVHSPISPKPELAKVRTHEAVYAHLADDTVTCCATQVCVARCACRVRSDLYRSA